ncbi:MAG: MjaI family restriction endonuclease, partial [Proteobacteria bacterium]|nr:MjaI family restriction endonuclease [Pseudomonadota bacterium]
MLEQKTGWFEKILKSLAYLRPSISVDPITSLPTVSFDASVELKANSIPEVLTLIESLGKKLYVKITEVIQAEVEDISEQDCIDYMLQLVIDRTFDGYMTEIKTVYGQLEKELGVKIEPAPDEWDRLFNVDFFIKVKEDYIGIQIKPVNQGIQLSQIFKEKDLQSKTHEKFTRQYGGKVFYIFSS